MTMHSSNYTGAAEWIAEHNLARTGNFPWDLKDLKGYNKKELWENVRKMIREGKAGATGQEFTSRKINNFRKFYEKTSKLLEDAYYERDFAWGLYEGTEDTSNLRRKEGNTRDAVQDAMARIVRDTRESLFSSRDLQQHVSNLKSFQADPADERKEDAYKASRDNLLNVEPKDRRSPFYGLSKRQIREIIWEAEYENQ